MPRPLFTILIVLALAAGVSHGWRVFGRDRDAVTVAAGEQIRADARAEAARIQPLPAAPRPESKVEKGSASDAASAPTADERGRARATLEKADAAHARGDFAGEERLLSDAAALVASGDDVESLALRKLAKRRGARARALDALRAQVKPNDFVGGAGLEMIVFGGRKYVVRVGGESGGEIVARLASGMELRLAPAQVTERRPCTPEEWRARVEKDLAERAERCDPESPLELYQVAYYCLENGLAEEATGWLDKALDHDARGVLVRTFAPEEAPPQPTVAMAAPSASPEMPAAPTSASDDAEGVITIPADPALEADAQWPEAQRALDDARGHYRGSYGSGPQADEELRAAMRLLDRAFEILNGLAARFPDSVELSAKTTEVNMLRFDCHKRSKVSGR